ncbi:MAG: hypothetical protein ABH815_01555 [Candidatus Omnitrophota bacterium]
MDKKHSNKGIALFISLTLLFLLSIGAITVLLTAYNYANITENEIKRLRAITLAEAGINYAYWQLRTNESNFVTEAAPPDGAPPIYPDPSPNAPGVVIIVTSGPLPDSYTIQSKVEY